MKCPQCARPLLECRDADRVWYPQRTICYASMEAASANALYDKRHDALPFHDGTFESWAKHRTPSHPYHFRDGVTVWVHTEDLAPDDDFLGLAAGGVDGGAVADGDL